MLFIKFNHVRIIFISLFIIVQFDLLHSQIRFPEEDAGGNRPPVNSGPNPGRPVNNINNNWFYRTNCMSYRYVPGYCVPLIQCNELKYTRDFSILRRSLCGFYGNDPKVCCPAQGNMNGDNNGYPNSNVTPNPYSTYSTPGNDYSSSSTNNQPEPNYNNNDLTYPRALPQPCGLSTKETTRVVGGSPAIPGAWPWMVSLQYGKAGSRNHMCGAALISSNLIVTASHCVIDDGQVTSAKMLSVRLGMHNVEDENSPDNAGQEFEIDQVIPHPNYNKKFANDIAILKIKGNVQYNERIQPICLPYDSELIRTKSLTGRSAMITGWGSTSYGGSGSPTLLQATLKVVNPTFCKNAFQKWMTITEEYLCAASEGFDKDSCQGDSGGPLTMFDPNKKRWYLIGVVSFGKKCASKDMPGVYTRVSYPKILSWLSKYF